MYIYVYLCISMYLCIFLSILSGVRGCGCYEFLDPPCIMANIIGAPNFENFINLREISFKIFIKFQKIVDF